MWILVRILAAVCGVLYRYAAAVRRDKVLQHAGEIEYSEKRRKNKIGATVSHRIGVPLRTDVCFVITKESGLDRFFKLIGLSQEFQTGDAAFDEHIYIACDHPGFHLALRDDVELRSLIRHIMAGFDRLWSNGHMLYASTGQEIQTASWIRLLGQMRTHFASATTNTPGLFGDSFTWRALAVESLIWGMAGYAAVAAFGFFLNRVSYHLDRERLLVYGAAAAGLAVVALLASIVLFLQRSSRSHRILVESTVLLVLATPVFGIQLVSDINRGGDVAEPIVVQCLVTSHWSEKHPGRKGGHRYSYHAQLEHVAGELLIEGEIYITRDVYESLTNGATITIEIGRGRLGVRWIKSINGVPVAK